MERATSQIQAGATLRVGQICSNKRKGITGLVPWAASTWWDKVASGQIPPGIKLGPKTTVWPIETVLAIARGEHVK